MNSNDIYIVNPNYFLKEDKSRIVFCNRNLKKKNPEGISLDYIAFIHPLQAMMLTFFDGKRRLKEVTESISEKFKLPREKVHNLLGKYLENENEFCIGDGANEYYFPKKVLIKKNGQDIAYSYKPDDFNLSSDTLDFMTPRLNSPLDILLITNMNCYTNCIYCYADRKHSFEPMTLNKIFDIIEQAKDLKIREFDVNGGEFLLYKDWEKVLQKMRVCGFLPYISTKIPLSTKVIQKLKDSGLETIQLSIDSVIDHELINLLQVSPEYRDRIINSIKETEKHDLSLQTNSIITKYNCSDKSVRMLLNFLTTLKNIKQINISSAGYSMYIPEEQYKRLKPDEDDLKRIDAVIREYSEKNPDIEINFGSYVSNEEINGSQKKKKKLFDERSFCTANNTGLIILPDGKITICEELYWNRNFIIGDINEQTLEDVWNSKRAKELFTLDKSHFSSESRCNSCKEIENCIKMTRCWKLVLMAYGQENWDYPDPRCPYAPKANHEIFILENK